MPGATPAGGTGLEPAGSSAWRRASGKSSSKSRWRRSATQRTRSSTMASAVGVLGEAHAEGLGEARGGEVVVGGAQTAADHEQVGLGGQASTAGPQ